MMKSFLSAMAFLAQGVIGDTTLAVIPIGNPNVIQRINVEENRAISVNSVRALWASLHGISPEVPGRRRLPTTEGMPVMPDFFHKPQAGMLVCIKGHAMDLDEMTTLSNLLETTAPPMTLEAGSHSDELLKMAHDKILTMTFQVNQDTNETQVDSMLAEVVKALKTEYNSTVLHVVLDDESTYNGQVHDRRKLQEWANFTESKDSSLLSDASKTIYQIQYTQTCLWTTIGLLTILFSSMYMMAYMPLMADTLLFGEIAKMSTSE